MKTVGYTEQHEGTIFSLAKTGDADSSYEKLCIIISCSCLFMPHCRLLLHGLYIKSSKCVCLCHKNGRLINNIKNIQLDINYIKVFIFQNLTSGFCPDIRIANFDTESPLSHIFFSHGTVRFHTLTTK